MITFVPPVDSEEQRKLKPGSYPKGYERIFGLGSERVAVLNSYLISESLTVDQLIRVLKDEWGVFQDVRDSALRRQLFRYKRDFILPQQAKVAARVTGNGAAAKLAAAAGMIEENLDVLRELERAVEIQKARVVKLAAQENGLPLALPEQTRNIALLTDQLVKLGQMQMDLGILKKVPTRLSIAPEVADDEVQFLAAARLRELDLRVTVEALRYMRGHGLLEAPREVDAEMRVVVDGG